MYNIIRLYNQNRKKFWIIVIVVIFVLIIIQLLDFFAEIQIQEEQKQMETNQTNTESYKAQSKSIISGGSVDENYQDKFGKLIDNFLNACVNRNYEEAYQYLSTSCKEELYPSRKIFIDQYCNDKFEGNKQYNFQSWTSHGNYIYLIKIYENMLSSGQANPDYIEDYYCIVRENGEYKLNISGFVNKTDYTNKVNGKEGIYIAINRTRVYMDYQLYDITVKNNTGNTIMLDTRKETDKTYIINSNNIKIEALLHENKEEDLIIEEGQEKDIQIKFSNVYQHDIEINRMVFSEIVTSYNEYKNNQANYQKFESIEIEI